MFFFPSLLFNHDWIAARITRNSDSMSHGIAIISIDYAWMWRLKAWCPLLLLSCLPPLSSALSSLPPFSLAQLRAPLYCCLLPASSFSSSSSLCLLPHTQHFKAFHTHIELSIYTQITHTKHIHTHTHTNIDHTHTGHTHTHLECCWLRNFLHIPPFNHNVNARKKNNFLFSNIKNKQQNK